MRLGAALVDEELRKVEILLLARHARKLDERELDLLMAAITRDLPFAAPEDRDHVVRKAAHDVEKLALAGRLVIGDGSLDQMAGAIELVVVAQIGPAPVGLHALEPGIEISVLVLQLLVHVDDPVGARLEFRIGAAVERIGDRLDRLAEV